MTYLPSRKSAFRRLHLIASAAGALALLSSVVPSTAQAGDAVVTPLVARGLDPLIALNMTSLISSELDFMGAYENVDQLTEVPASLNSSCLNSASCLGGIAKSNGSQAVLTGALAQVGNKYDFFLVLYDNGRIVRKIEFTMPNVPSLIADGMAARVKELVTGEKPAEQSTTTAAVLDMDAFDDDEDEEDMAVIATGPGNSRRIATPGGDRPRNDELDDFDLDSDPEDDDRRKAEEEKRRRAAAATAAREEERQAAAAREEERRADEAREEERRVAAAAAARKEDERRAAAERRREEAKAEDRRQAAIAAEDARIRQEEEDAAAATSVDDDEDEFDFDFGGGGVAVVDDEEEDEDDDRGAVVVPTRRSTSSRDLDDPPERSSRSSSSSRDSSSRAKKEPTRRSTEDRYDFDEEPDTIRKKKKSSDREPDTVRKKKSKNSSSDVSDTKASIAIRAGYSRFQALNFVTYGGEGSFMATPNLAIVAGAEAYSTRRQVDISEFEDPEDAVAAEQWNTIMPLNAGIQYKFGASKVRPYVGGGIQIIPGVVKDEGGVAIGLRARGGADFAVTDVFGFNINIAAGMWSGQQFQQIQEDFGASALVPQFSAGTIFLF
jgi:hypothetical protein